MTHKCFETLDIWHKIVADRDVSVLHSIVHPDAVFRSPFVYKPYPGREAVVFVISNVIEIFEDFVYNRKLISDDGRSAFLEFTTNIGDRSLKGMDLFAFDENGLITELEVMVRPMSGLTALAEQMAPRMAKLG